MIYLEDLKMEKMYKIKSIISKHIVPIIADIDAGFGNEATYLLTKKMIEAARAIQVENQVSDAKQCGHQDGKVTVPHEDFMLKLMLFVMPFRIRVDDGVVARTDSEGASLN
jgi:isocitrate lyase